MLPYLAAHGGAARSAATEQTLALLLRVDVAFGAGLGGAACGGGGVAALRSSSVSNPRLDSSRNSIAVSAWSRATIGDGTSSTGLVGSGSGLSPVDRGGGGGGGSSNDARFSSVSRLAMMARDARSSSLGP